MKTRLFGIAVLLLATFAAVRSTPVEAAPGGGLDCRRFCMVALCPQPQTCGAYVTPSGSLACGCHG